MKRYKINRQITNNFFTKTSTRHYGENLRIVFLVSRVL